MKNVAIIIINYNSGDYTIECVHSIEKFTPGDFPYEIIIVDNNSQRQDIENLKTRLAENKKVRIIESSINLGFSGGNMVGIKYSNARYIFFLNNDCVFLNDNISILYNFLQENPGVGLCSGQMYNSDLSFHHSFTYFPSLKLKLLGPSLLRLFSPLNYPKRKIEYKEPIKVPSVTGASMFLDHEKFMETGGFDTNYFLYCEEEDLAFNLKKKGYSAYLVPEAKFIHHRGISTQRDYLIERENYISLLYFFRKNYNYFEYSLLKLIYSLKSFSKIFNGVVHLKLAFFILMGAPLKSSLRFRQGAT